MQPNASVAPYRIASTKFVAAYVVTMRPYLLFVSGITGIAGMAFAPGLTTSIAIPIALASFLSYGFGQALTDCFQIDTDSISAPYRPLTQGQITQRQVLAVSLIGLCACVAVFALLNPLNLALGILSAAGLATYTHFKRRWWGGPWYNAWIVSVLFSMGYCAGSGKPLQAPRNGFYFTLGAVFCGYANFVLAGYFKDIDADAKAGYNTFPVVFGRAAAAIGSDLFAAGMWVSVIGFFYSAQGIIIPLNLLTILFLAGAAIATLRGQMLLHRVTTDEASHPAIGLVVHSYILSLAAVSNVLYPAWGVTLLGFYLLFVLTLKARPSRSQI
jgi:4-hydroxybenzoate polyprenyltransferase